MDEQYGYPNICVRWTGPDSDGGKYLIGWADHVETDHERELTDQTHGEIKVMHSTMHPCSTHTHPGELITYEEIRRVASQADLAEVAESLGVREDWHEPDEQDVTVEIAGNVFDNAGIWGHEQYSEKSFEELHVVIFKNEEPVAAVNLATLLAMAAGTYR